MKRKMGYIAVGMLFAFILSISIDSFAEYSRKKESDQSLDHVTQEAPSNSIVASHNKEGNVEGQPVLIDNEQQRIIVFDGLRKWEFNLNSQTAIYRNEKKVELRDVRFTDRVEVILNSKQEVRYVNAKGEDTSQVMAFKDVEQARWASESIEILRSRGIMHGYQDETFKPNHSVRRVEAIVAVVKYMGLEDVAQALKEEPLYFKDASIIEQKYSWAKGYIIAALHHGLFETSEESFYPEHFASRVWLASLLVKSREWKGEAYSQMTKLPPFKDSSQIPAGAIGYVNAALERGIINGYPDQTFRPQGKVSRAELAVLLLKADQ
ncbi:S-layer homology domain-containing protein [Ammoniphilus sp. YIM 78166]|uniref:S-layer homology domain-containing protein n=1 Tax=Ammoniphilus sp. YIM 78166 TaxID=1644106 RepID=UPI00106F6806|nr:S-layer homology domain-containing protein [Ammoniphilus sp. YIM 78166]